MGVFLDLNRKSQAELKEEYLLDAMEIAIRDDADETNALRVILVFVEVPEGYELQIRSRSGLATKGVFVVNGVGCIDSKLN